MSEIEVDPPTLATLHELATESGQSVQEVLAVAVEGERRRRFHEKVARTYSRLHAVVTQEFQSCLDSPLMERT